MCSSDLVASAEGVPVILLPFELGRPKGFGVFEKDLERLGELVVLLDQRLAVHLLQKGGFPLVLRRGGDEMRPCLQVKALLVGQHLVPDIPAAAESVFKQLRLGLIWVETDFEDGILGRVPRRHLRNTPVLSLKTYTFSNSENHVYLFEKPP